MDYTFIKRLGEKYGCNVMFNEPLATYTSMKIGGNCDVMICPNSENCLIDIITECRRNEAKFYVFGKGTNVLISDKGLRGVVILISTDYSNIAVKKIDDDIVSLYADAGASLTKLCRVALDNSLTGLEFAYGIPGSIGGAVYMNAGAYGGEIKDIVRRVRCINNNGEILNYTNEESNFSYRHSLYIEQGLIILGAEFFLKKGDKIAIEARMNQIMTYRKDKQPLEYPSAGSTFKRPPGDFAARLIDECGLKGKSIGGAEVSDKHSGFIINKRNATFDDVIGVVDMVKKEVYEKTGVSLECEMLIFE